VAATARARAALEAEFARRDEQRDDAMAAYKAQVQADADAERDAAREQDRRRLRQAVEAEEPRDPKTGIRLKDIVRF
jgi:hypothetical protein